jgi:hypothetical protein
MKWDFKKLKVTYSKWRVFELLGKDYKSDENSRD